MKKTNKDEEYIFKSIYICVGSLKRGFLDGSRSVLCLDDCFLKGPWDGQVLAIVAEIPITKCILLLGVWHKRNARRYGCSSSNSCIKKRMDYDFRSTKGKTASYFCKVFIMAQVYK